MVQLLSFLFDVLRTLPEFPLIWPWYFQFYIDIYINLLIYIHPDIFLFYPDITLIFVVLPWNMPYTLKYCIYPDIYANPDIFIYPDITLIFTLTLIFAFTLIVTFTLICVLLPCDYPDIYIYPDNFTYPDMVYTPK